MLCWLPLLLCCGFTLVVQGVVLSLWLALKNQLGGDAAAEQQVTVSLPLLAVCVLAVCELCTHSLIALQKPTSVSVSEESVLVGDLLMFVLGCTMVVGSWVVQEHASLLSSVRRRRPPPTTAAEAQIAGCSINHVNIL